MAGDINLRERLVLFPSDNLASSQSLENVVAPSGGHIMHQYGPRVMLLSSPPAVDEIISETMPQALLSEAADMDAEIPDGLNEAEQLGLQAFQLRQSVDYFNAKAKRPNAEENWGNPSNGAQPLQSCTEHDPLNEENQSAEAEAGAPATSARLTGSVAVGIIIVEGPNKNLKFSVEERLKVIAEVQNGLSWLGSQNPASKITWKYDIKYVKLSIKPGADSLSSAQKEALWRNPAMKKLGYSGNMDGVKKYANDIRTKLNTNWTYCAFFTKYPLGWFAYASIGGPRLVMDYHNDGWGVENIDRVFAHETGHIFGAPDEYKSSGCNCGGSWGYYKKPNGNCENCAPGGGVECIMRSNSWSMCNYTPYHLGFPLSQQRYSGVWRSGTDKYALWVNASWGSFVNKWQAWGQQNLRLEDLKITYKGNTRRYHGTWREGKDAYGLWVNADWNNFVNKWQTWGKSNLRLVDLEIIQINGNTRYSGVWRYGKDAYGLWVNASWSNFISKWQEWGKKGLRLVDIKITNFNGKLRYSGVWRYGNDAYGLWVNATWSSFVNKWQEWGKKGLRLVDLEIAVINGQVRYSGVWRAGNYGYGLWVNANWQNFKAKWEEWGKQGLRLVDIQVFDPSAPASTNAPELEAPLGIATEMAPEGFGFLSSEQAHGYEDTDIEVGALEEIFPSSNGAAAMSNGHQEIASSESESNTIVQDSNDGLGGVSRSITEGADAEDGLGGLSGEAAPARSQQEDGFGGIIGEPAQTEMPPSSQEIAEDSEQGEMVLK